MSSNIKTKNLIYKFKKYDELPYQSSKMIDYSSNDQYVNSTSLNNTYGQCVDNDLFIAKHLKDAIGSSSQIGPILATNDTQIAALPDGTKIFNDVHDATIMQKCVKSLQDSMHKSTNSLASTTNFIQSIEQSTAIICTLTTTYVATLDEITKSGSNFSPSIIVYDESGRNVKVTSIIRNGNYAGVLFGATTSVPGTAGIYQLIISNVTREQKKYVLKLIQPLDNEVISMSMDNDSSLLVATSNIVYRCAMNGNDIQSIDAIATFSEAIGTGNICAIQSNDNYAIVFTSNNGIYHISKQLSDKTGFINASIKQISNDKIIAYESIKSNNTTYLATNKGLCILVNDIIRIIDENYTEPIYHIEIDNTNTIWFATDNAIFKMSSNMEIEKYHTFINKTINDFHIICGVKFVALNDGLYYEKSVNNFIKLTLNDFTAQKIIVKSQSNSNADIYIAGSSSNDHIATTSAFISCQFTDKNYDFIDGLSTISSFNDAGSYPVGMIQLKDKYYAFVNQQYGSLMYDIKNMSSICQWDNQIIGVIKHPNNRHAYVLFDGQAYVLDQYDNTSISGTMTGFGLAGTNIICNQHLLEQDVWLLDVETSSQPSYNNDTSVWTLPINNNSLSSNEPSDALELTLTADDSLSSIYAYKEVQCLVTLSNNNSIANQFQLIRLLLHNNGIDVKESLNLDVNTNVINYVSNDANHYIVMALSNDETHQSKVKPYAIELSIQMSQYNGIANSELADIVNSQQVIFVDNIYSFVMPDDYDSAVQNQQFTYNRADYIVPTVVSNNISVLYSTCTYDNGIMLVDPNTISIDEIQETSGITNITHNYNDTHDIMCFISGTYNDNLSLTDSSAFYVIPRSGIVDDPKLPFQFTPEIPIIDDVSCICTPHVRQSVIGVSRYNINTNNSEFYATELSSSDDSLYIIQHNYKNGLINKTIPINIDNEFTPIALTKSSYGSNDNYIYVLATNHNNDNISYSISAYRSVDDNIKFTKLSTLNDINCLSIASFTFTYANDSDISAYVGIATDGQHYPFQIRQSNKNGGTLRLVFSNKEYDFEFSQLNNIITNNEINEKILTTYTSTWGGKNAQYLVSLNQTKNSFNNQMFSTALQMDDTTSVLYAVDSYDGLYQLDSEATIYKTNAPNELSDITWIGKDEQLSCNMLMQGNSLSIISSDMLSTMTLPNGASQIQLLQCYDKTFNERINVLYSLYGNDQYSICISSLFANGDVSSQTILQSTSSPNVNVLNIANHKKYPYVSYFSSIGTLSYDNIFSASITYNSIASCNISPNIMDFVLDANNVNNAYVVNKPAGEGATLLKATYDETNALTQISSLGNITNIAFPNKLENVANAIATGLNGTNPQLYAIEPTGIKQINSNSYLENIIRKSSIGMLSYENNIYSLYGALDGLGSFVLQFSDIGNVNEVSKSQVTTPATTINIVSRNSNDYAIQTPGGIYSYDVIHQQIDSLYESYDGIVGMLIANDTNDAKRIWYSAFGNTIVSSYDLCVWDNIVSVGHESGNNISINNFVQLNPYVVLASKCNGNDPGLFYTTYEYDLIENAMQFTAESAYYMYYDNVSALEYANNVLIAQHIYDTHLSDSTMQLINNCMGVDFQISGFMDSDGANVAYNDYIEQLIVGDAKDGNILAYASNPAINNKWKQLSCNYIAKCWKSGLTELYIYLPTTYTYYIPHIEGASQCNSYGTEVKANGKSLVPTIEGNATSVQVDIMSQMFNIGTLLENTIKPNSLPLQTYKDEVAAVACASTMFHSFVCPSLAEEFDSSNKVLNYYNMKYYCFGSDAQAIKLSFFNPSQHYGKKYKSIIYNANGGVFDDFPLLSQVKQIVYEDSNPTPIYWNIFEKLNSQFIGWSWSPTAISSDASYLRTTKFSYDTMQYDTLKLYACYKTYDYDINWYTIIFDANGGDSQKTMKVKAGTSIGPLPVATKEHYDFVGWYTEIEGGIEILPSNILYGNVILYARYVSSIAEKTMVTYTNHKTMYFDSIAEIEDKEHVVIVVVGNIVTSINSNAFYNCENLESITLPNSVKRIEDFAFSGCTNLATIEMPSNVSYVGTNVFNNCKYLIQVVMKDKTQEQAEQMLKNAGIPDNCQIVGQTSSTVVTYNIPLPNDIKLQSYGTATSTTTDTTETFPFRLLLDKTRPEYKTILADPVKGTFFLGWQAYYATTNSNGVRKGSYGVNDTIDTILNLTKDNYRPIFFIYGKAKNQGTNVFAKMTDHYKKTLAGAIARNSSCQIDLFDPSIRQYGYYFVVYCNDEDETNANALKVKDFITQFGPITTGYPWYMAYCKYPDGHVYARYGSLYSLNATDSFNDIKDSFANTMYSNGEAIAYAYKP